MSIALVSDWNRFILVVSPETQSNNNSIQQSHHKTVIFVYTRMLRCCYE